MIAQGDQARWRSSPPYLLTVDSAHVAKTKTSLFELLLSTTGQEEVAEKTMQVLDEHTL